MNGEDMIEVTSLNEPDFEWSETDLAGHVHRWAGDWHKASLPTLNRIVDHQCTDDCDDECYTRAHYECRECGAVVTPETCPSPERRFVPGLFSR